MNRTDLYLVTILLLILQLGDIATTSLALSLGGREANILSIVLNQHGELGMYAVKMTLIGIALYLAWHFDARCEGRLRRVLWAACGGYIGVVFWNAGQLHALGVI
jgi:hypothetical protein